jgi:hypothetical protein
MISLCGDSLRPRFAAMSAWSCGMCFSASPRDSTASPLPKTDSAGTEIRRSVRLAVS